MIQNKPHIAEIFLLPFEETPKECDITQYGIINDITDNLAVIGDFGLYEIGKLRKVHGIIMPDIALSLNSINIDKARQNAIKIKNIDILDRLCKEVGYGKIEKLEMDERCTIPLSSLEYEGLSSIGAIQEVCRHGTDFLDEFGDITDDIISVPLAVSLFKYLCKEYKPDKIKQYSRLVAGNVLYFRGKQVCFFNKVGPDITASCELFNFNDIFDDTLAVKISEQSAKIFIEKIKNRKEKSINVFGKLISDNPLGVIESGDIAIPVSNASHYIENAYIKDNSLWIDIVFLDNNNTKGMFHKEWSPKEYSPFIIATISPDYFFNSKIIENFLPIDIVTIDILIEKENGL